MAEELRRFDDDTYYRPDDPAMRIIGTPNGLAGQRCRGLGPSFTKVGRRVLYLERDLNEYIDRGRVDLSSTPQSRGL